MIEIELDVDEGLADAVPTIDDLEAWARNALQGLREEALIDMRIVGAAEMQALNRQFRGHDRPTNVLSFPAELPPGVEVPLLGDLALCADVIAREAAEQDKPLSHHWAHMVTHGTLHLIGYDHVEAKDAVVMERLEKQALARLGIPDPYRD